MSESITESLEAAFAEVEGQDDQQPEEVTFDEPQEEGVQEVSESDEVEQEAEDEAPDTEDTQEYEPVEDDVEPLERWDEEFTTAFNSLDKKTKKLVMDQYKNFQRDYTKKSMEIADTKREYESITQAMEPVRSMLQQAGMTHADGIRALVNAQQQLMTNPAYAIDSLVQQYGGNAAKDIVAGLAAKYGIQADPDDGHADYEDPEVKALKQELQSMKQMFQQSQTQTQQQKQVELQNQIKLFEDAKDDQGNLLHPHFQTLRTKMGKLIQAGEATDLDDAYDKAIYLDPELRQQVLEEQRKQQAAKDDKARKEKLARSKAATKKPSGRTTPPEPKRGKKSIEEDMEEAWAAAGL